MSLDDDSPPVGYGAGGSEPDLIKWAGRMAESAPAGAVSPTPVDWKREHDAAVDAALRAQKLRPVPPWSAEYKLRNALGRPALAKRIVDALPQPLAVELGDVLWIILQQRVAEELDAINVQVDLVVAERVAWYETQSQQKREELSRERFGRTSRLD